MSQTKATVITGTEQSLGRGVDALFSSPPQAKQNAPSDEVLPPDDPELEAMLYSEVMDATREYEVVQSSASSTPTISPSQDIASEGVILSDEEILRSIDDPLGARKGKDASTQENDPTDTPPEALPNDVSQNYPQARVRIVGMLPEVRVQKGELDNDRVSPQSPFSPPPYELVLDDARPQPLRTAGEQEIILSRIEKDRIRDLNKTIDRLYSEIPKHISNRPDITAQALGLLRQARTILIENPVDFVEAEYKTQQAQSLYNRIENSEAWGDRYGWRVFYYEVFLFFLLLLSFLGLLAFNNEFSGLVASLIGSEAPGEGLFTAVGFWATFVWGGIGGVVGAMYVLWIHVSERQDFERQHIMWYVSQPIMGLILGGVTFLIINAGLLSLQGGQIAAQQLRTEIQFFPALIAFIAGFRPQFVFGLLTKIIKVINPTENESQA